MTAITQFHDPEVCRAAAKRTEDAYRKLRTLMACLDGPEEFHPQAWALPPEHPVQPTPPISTPVDQHSKPQPDIDSRSMHCRCVKRNGLQDYCGEGNRYCYMNPNAMKIRKNAGATGKREEEAFPAKCKKADGGVMVCSSDSSPVHMFYLVPVRMKGQGDHQ